MKLTCLWRICRHFVLPLLFLGLPLPATADARFDVVGLRLGMTQNEVMQALAAHGVAPSDIHQTQEVFGYSDGVKNDHRTEPFLARIEAGKSTLVGGRRKSDTLTIVFSPPPRGGRVVAVMRMTNNPVDPPTGKQFAQALYEKYGQPDDANIGGKWLFGAGTQNCLPNGMPRVTGRDKQSILDGVLRKRAGKFDTSFFVNHQVKRLDDCANILEYRVGTLDDRPATRVTASMVDVQAWVKATLAADEWVDGLREQAVKQRQGGASKPVL